MIFRIPDRLVFPDPNLADPNGLLGVGGDLEPERVMLAYHSGIFPWYSEGTPIYWWSPNPRMVLFPGELVVRRSLAKRIRQNRYRITADQAFEEVMLRCAEVDRPDQPGTWITRDMLSSYKKLHRHGLAHSVEAWEGDELVGGLYGVAVGSVFCGESMFALRPDASKIAFVEMVRQMLPKGLSLIDAQVHTPHLETFGARLIPRLEFLDLLAVGREGRLPDGPWQFDQKK